MKDETRLTDALMELWDLLSWALIIMVVFVFMRNMLENIQTMEPNDAVLNFVWTTGCCIAGVAQQMRLFGSYLKSPSYIARHMRMKNRERSK